MFGNFLTAAFRNIKKHPGYAAINLFGLALGLAVAMLILLFVRHEVSFDSYHDRADDIYRIILDGSFAGQTITGPLAPAPMGPTMLNDFPEVESSARVFGFLGTSVFRNGDIAISSDDVVLADSSLFDVLSFDFLQGNPTDALTETQTVILTESMAKRLFGDDEAFGQFLVIGDTTQIKVDGIIADPPSNSHVQFDAYRSIIDTPMANSDQWIANNFVTYLKLRPGSDAGALEAKFPGMFATNLGPQLEQMMGVSYEDFIAGGNVLAYSLQALQEVHLGSNDFQIDLQTPGNRAYVVLFSAIAVFILLLACINFMNLATARSATRAREIGIRKAVGSDRRQLITQFLLESSTMTAIALAMAAVFVWIALPGFNNVSGLSLSMASLITPAFLGWMVLGAALVSLAAGLYPAIYLSSFDPAVVLKTETFASGNRSWLRNGLVVFQFTISIGLLIGTFVVRDQLAFIQNKDLGFDREHVVVLTRGFELGEQYQAFKDEISTHSNIVAIGGASNIPGAIHGGTGYFPEGGTPDQAEIFAPIVVDHGFVDAMGIRMSEGRAFSEDFPGDTAAYMINQAALRKLGWESGVGRLISGMDQFDGENFSTGQREVVGVIEDYHFMSFRNPITGAVYQLTNQPMPNILIRVTGNEMQSTLAHIRSTWASFRPDTPINLTFLNDSFENLAASDERLAQLFAGFSLFAILIAGLGLFGLAFFVTEQRTREIGVRKALGASVREIVLLLSKDFTRLVLVSLVVAIPLSWLGMSRWLDGFVYRTDISLVSIGLAGILALGIAWATVSYQSIKAARSNPIKALRHS